MFNLFSKKTTQPQQLFFHTDVHCHIVPGIDDGSPSVERSLELVERMRSWGLSRIIASPHVTETTFENTPDMMDTALAELNAQIAARGIDIDISHSAEYRLDDLFKRHFEEGILVPYPDNYLLVENSFIQEPWGLDEILFQLKIKGFKPVLAHPERYTYYYGNRERYKKIWSDGTLFQVNLLSLAGHYGKETRRIAEWMMERGMISFLGTDLHNHRHADAIEGYLRSKEYRRDRKALEATLLNDTL